MLGFSWVTGHMMIMDAQNHDPTPPGRHFNHGNLLDDFPLLTPFPPFPHGPLSSHSLSQYFTHHSSSKRQESTAKTAQNKKVSPKNELYAFFLDFSSSGFCMIVVEGHRFPFLPHEGVLGDRTVQA